MNSVLDEIDSFELSDEAKKQIESVLLQSMQIIAGNMLDVMTAMQNRMTSEIQNVTPLQQPIQGLRSVMSESLDHD